MYKDNEIDSRGKIILKGIQKYYLDMVIINSPSITDAYDQYMKDGTELTLRTTLFRLQKMESK